jgi:hypothetical protein
LQPSHSFLTELRTFIPRICWLTAFVAGFADAMLSCLSAEVTDLACEPHVSDEHDRANVGIEARVRIEGTTKERRRSARAADVESIFGSWMFV